MPVAFVWKDGAIDYLTVRGNLDIVQRQRCIGKPRWCEWGVDVSNVITEDITFYKKEVYLLNRQTLMSYTFPVYVQSLSDGICVQKVKEIASRMMLRF